MFLHVQLNFKISKSMSTPAAFLIQFPTQLKSNSLEGSIQSFPIVTSRCMYDPLGLECHSRLFPTSACVIANIDIMFHVHSQREWNLRRSFDPNTWASSMGLKKFTVRASQPQRFNPVGLLFSLGRF